MFKYNYRIKYRHTYSFISSPKQKYRGIQINVQHPSRHLTRGNSPTVIQKKVVVIDKYEDPKEPAKSRE